MLRSFRTILKPEHTLYLPLDAISNIFFFSFYTSTFDNRMCKIVFVETSSNFHQLWYNYWRKDGKEDSIIHIFISP